MPTFTPISVHDLGEYLREQRQSAQLSLRQPSEVAWISNPYISQIERGLKKPSAEILQALAKALRISAESLYVRAGIIGALIEDAGADVEGLSRDAQGLGQGLQDLGARLLQAALNLGDVGVADPRDLGQLPQ